MALQRWAVVEPIFERSAPARVLEIGCGMGGFGARLASRYRYVGLEQDEISCTTARERIEAAGGRVVHGSVGDVDDGPFDLVCAFEVLEHIEDDAGALKEWVAKLAPAGTLVISVPAGSSRFGTSDAFVGHFRRYDADQLEKTLFDAGLTDVELTWYAWPLGFLAEAVRNRVAARRQPAQESTSMPDRTAGSGRWMQPGPVTGELMRIATAPFIWAQRTRPDRGVGLVAVARRPS
jgi:SAM-dependent methyltransferase